MPRPRLLVVAVVHLDSQWRWTIRDTIRDFIPRTLAENFALFRSHPNYVLSFEGAFRYMLSAEYYPEAYEELKRWCQEGRWVPVGAMLDAPDVNVVAPESLIRHILYGNNFFEHQFGRRSRDIFLPDCFGFSQALPSVAAHCGLESFSTSKLIKWKAPDVIPFDIGRWRGPDGAEILAVLQPGGYGEGIDEDLSRSTAWGERLRAIGERSGVAVGMRYFGTGDRGGSPDRASLDRLERSVGSKGPIEVRCRPSDVIADELDETARAALPVHDSEILLPTHGTGGWTSQAALKRWNRKNEQLAAATERAAVVAHWLGSSDDAQQHIREAWLRFLWHQMHDDLPGTSIPAAYDITWNDQAVAANRFAGVLVDAVTAIATALDTRSRGLPLLVYNPTGARREDVVEVVLERSLLASEDPAAGDLTVLSGSGDRLPTQLEPIDESHLRVLFSADVRPVSFTFFELVRQQAPRSQKDTLRGTRDGLENHRYRVGIDSRGNIDSIFDKRLGRELLQAPLGLELFRDRSMRWPAWEIQPETILGANAEPIDGPSTVRIVETGPVRVALEIHRRFRGSEIRQTVRLADGSAGDRLEIATVLDWATRGRLLKATFPLRASNPLAAYDLGLGLIRRDNNSPERYEVPAQQWAEITDRDGEFGTAVLNDCLYGWDKPADHILRLSLARSPSTLRKYPHQRTQDHGRHRFVYAVLGHAGQSDRATISRQAESLNQPLLAFAVEASPGPLGRHISFFDPGESDIAVAALKRHESRDRYVVRLRDIGERRQSATLELGAAVNAAERLRGDERPVVTQEGPAQETAPAVKDGSIELELSPSGLATIGFTLEAPAAGVSEQRELALELPFDRRAASSQQDAECVDFDGSGASLPAELLPDSLSIGGITFRLGPRDQMNALRCRGQTIDLSPGYRQLWILAASLRADTDVELGLGPATRDLRVACWTGQLAERPRRARWGGLLPGRDARLVTDDLAWLGTHRHRARAGSIEDEAYVFCYLYRYLIELPEQARELRLPDEPSLHLFAATLATGGARARALQPLYGP